MGRFATRYIPPVILLSIATAVFLSGCSGPEGNVTDGKRWYRMHNCYACHGENGNDGDGPDITGIDMGYHRFVHRLRNAETAVMPAFSKEKINNQDAADILAFINSLK